MATGKHYYSSIAVQSTLAAAMTSGQTTMVVPNATFVGYPTSYPFTVRLEGGTSGEELVDVTSLASTTGGQTTYNVDRGVDGSTARAHASGASVDHPVTGRDLNDASAHVYQSQGMHGLNGTDGVNSGGGLQVQGAAAGTTPMLIQSVATATVPTSIFQGVSGQDIMQWRSNAGTVLGRVDGNGVVYGNGNLPTIVAANGNAYKLVFGTVTVTYTSGTPNAPTATVAGLTTVTKIISMANITGNTAVASYIKGTGGNNIQCYMTNNGTYSGNASVEYLAIGV